MPAPLRNDAGASVLCLRFALVETCGISQVPWQSLCEHALLFDPGGRVPPATNDALDVAFRSVDDVGSASIHLSRLNHTACSLAVYASQLGLLRSTPRKTRFPLAANLGGTGLSPVGLLHEVSTPCCSTHITLFPPPQGFPWRTRPRTPVAAGMHARRLFRGSLTREGSSVCRSSQRRSCTA